VRREKGEEEKLCGCNWERITLLIRLMWLLMWLLIRLLTPLCCCPRCAAILVVRLFCWC